MSLAQSKTTATNLGIMSSGSFSDLTRRLDDYEKGLDVPAHGGRGKVVNKKTNPLDPQNQGAPGASKVTPSKKSIAVPVKGGKTTVRGRSPSPSARAKSPSSRSPSPARSKSPSSRSPSPVGRVVLAPGVSGKTKPVAKGVIKVVPKTATAAAAGAVITAPSAKSVKSTKVIPVDPYNPSPGNEVYKDYSAMLNQVDIGENANKFYSLQLLTDGTRYYLVIRYGRVGLKGTVKFDSFSDPFSAVRAFESQYTAKTGNSWGQPFTPKNKKYTLMETEYDVEVDVPDGILNKTLTSTGSKLPPEVISLVESITNTKMIQTAIQQFNIDLTKMPLGRISNKQIDDAEKYLKQIEILLKKHGDSPNDNDLKIELEYLSSRFWTLIPYATKHNERLPTIKTMKEVTKRSTMLDDMRQIMVAVKLFTQSNNIDTAYLSLKTDIEVLPKVDPEYQQMLRYIQTTQGQTHHFKLNLLNVFRLRKDDLDKADINNVFSSIGNHKLLFHGSRTTNFAGILSTGFRMPTPSTVANGTMFGYGIYFADSVTKSYQYTQNWGFGGKSKGMIAVCEVALGRSQMLKHADSSPLPMGFDSRMGVGVNYPDPKQNEKWVVDGSVMVPIGNMIKTQGFGLGSSLTYNEYIVFSGYQYRFRYLLELESI